MNRNNVIDAIGRIDDEMIEQVDSLRHMLYGSPQMNNPKKEDSDNLPKPEEWKRNKHWMKLAALAACFCLIIVTAYRITKSGLFYSGDGGNGGKDGMTYMSYAGPVFPLSAADGGAGISVERNIDFDFSPYETETETYKYDNEIYTDEHSDSKSIVTDRYTLSNAMGGDQTMTLLYPFSASLDMKMEQKPTITVNGREVATELFVGPYAGGFEGAGDGDDSELMLNLTGPDSWEAYKTLLESGYLQCAFDTFPELDQPVIVYELYDLYGEESDEAPAPTISMEFYMDYDRTATLTYGFDGLISDIESGYCSRNAFIPYDSENLYMIVLGEDIGKYTINGYTDGSCEQKMENAGGKVKRYECTLGEIFEKTAKQYRNQRNSQSYDDIQSCIVSAVPETVWIGLAAEMLCDYGLLSDTPSDRYSDGMLESIFDEIDSAKRVMYLRFNVTIPANASMDVCAEMVKPASENFICFHKGEPACNGYDMVTQLGSNLSFTSQTASISNTDYIEIVDQNFGFELENEITKVELDRKQEHYFLDVQKLDERK